MRAVLRGRIKKYLIENAIEPRPDIIEALLNPMLLEMHRFLDGGGHLMPFEIELLSIAVADCSWMFRPEVLASLELRFTTAKAEYDKGQAQRVRAQRNARDRARRAAKRTA